MSDKKPGRISFSKGEYIEYLLPEEEARDINDAGRFSVDIGKDGRIHFTTLNDDNEVLNEYMANITGVYVSNEDGSSLKTAIGETIDGDGTVADIRIDVGKGWSLGTFIREEPEPLDIAPALAPGEIMLTSSTEPVMLLERAILRRVSPKTPALPGYEVNSEDDNEGDVHQTITTYKHVETGNKIITTVPHELGVSNRNAGQALKLYHYILTAIAEKMVPGDRYLPRFIDISIDMLVKSGMYANVKAARRSIEKLVTSYSLCTIGGEYGTGYQKSEMKVQTALLSNAYNVVDEGRVIRLYPVQQPDAKIFMLGYRAQVPTWVWQLETNAHVLAFYVFQKARVLAKYGNAVKLTCSEMAAVIGLPEWNAVNGRKHAERITEPINRAIAEIRAAEAAEAKADERPQWLKIECRQLSGEARNAWNNGTAVFTISGDYAKRNEEGRTSRSKRIRKQAIKSNQKRKKREENVSTVPGGDNI